MKKFWYQVINTDRDLQYECVLQILRAVELSCEKLILFHSEKQTCRKKMKK